MLATRNETLKGKKVSISGFGNVAWGAALKATELGAQVVTISGPDGYIFDHEGISGKKIEYMLELRASNQDIVKPYSYVFEDGEFHEGKCPWEVKVDIALPCATQNELNGEDARLLIANWSNDGCRTLEHGMYTRGCRRI
jgi:glutamate dehydrogenase (NADP+)